MIFYQPIPIDVRAERFFAEGLARIHKMKPGMLTSRYGARRALRSSRVREARHRFKHDRGGVLWQVALALGRAEEDFERELDAIWRNAMLHTAADLRPHLLIMPVTA